MNSTIALNAQAAAQPPGSTAGASTWTNPAATASVVVNDIDHVLWFAGRCLQLTFFLMILGAIAIMCLFRKQIGDATGLSHTHCRDLFRKRHLKSIVKFFCCCGCACCGPLSHGFQKFDEAQHVLVLTLLAVDSLRKKTSFWIEATTRPQEGVPKASRFHRGVQGSYDLGEEHLELDWHGDEDFVIVRVYQESDPEHKPFAKVKIPRDHVEKYVKEASMGKDDPSKGARSFALFGTRGHDADIKPEEMTMVQKQMMKKFYSSIKLPEPNLEEMQRLKTENEHMTRQLHSTGFLHHTEAHHDDDDHPPHIPKMNMVIRFEIRHRSGPSASSLS